MDIPMEVLNYQTRDGKPDVVGMSMRILEFEDLSTTLFVDDMCDSGKTITDIQELYPDARFAVLCTRRKDIIEYSPIELDEADESWIDFPWEKNLT
jgi:hypoxanthine phosphoribosyltransferase